MDAQSISQQSTLTIQETGETVARTPAENHRRSLEITRDTLEASIKLHESMPDKEVRQKTIAFEKRGLADVNSQLDSLKKDGDPKKK